MSSDKEEDSAWVRRGLNTGPSAPQGPPAQAPQAPPPQYGQPPASVGKPPLDAPASLGPRRLVTVAAVLVLIAVMVAVVLILV
ncbi:MAG: hypothetical protein GEU86_14470 [Actinophytocola sp.]|nr:hypothetical protein [Actinophytocola sp.]